MESARYISKTELARRTGQVIREVRQGQTTVIENRGQPEVAVVDIIDYHIMRAVMHYLNHPKQIDIATGLSDQQVAERISEQDRYNLVFAYYLAESISLSRAADLLNLAWLDLRGRCHRLDVPLRIAPSDLGEARKDLVAALKSSI